MIEQLFNTPPAVIDEVNIGSKYKHWYVYEAGNGYYTFKSFVIDRLNITIDAIIDKKFGSNKSQLFDSIVSVGPKKIPELKKEKSIVVITIGGEERNLIKKQLEKQKFFSKVVFADEFYSFHLHFEKEDTNSEKYFNADDVFRSFYLMEDEYSRQVFYDFISFFYHKKFNKIKSRPISEQYFPSDISIDYTHWVNLGGYDGDTIRNAFSRNIQIKNIISCEPDFSNYRKLSKLLLKSAEKHPKVKLLLLPIGVSDKLEILPFNHAGTNSSICDHSDTLAVFTPLDNAIANLDVSFINMDIEGGELEALVGSERLIKKFTPDLSISVYHRPKDLWTITLYLHSLNSGYKFYLRNYTSFPAETILYASIK